MSENHHSIPVDKVPDCGVSKHQKIVITATQHFIKYGYANATTDGIAKDAGVSKGLIFHHFNSKEDLAFEVFKQLLNIDYGMDKFIESISIENEDMEITDLKAFIEKYVRNTINEMQTNVVSSLLFMDLLVNLKNEEIKNKIKKLLHYYLSQIIELFKKMDIINPVVKARTIFAIIDGLGFQFFFLDEVQFEITTDDFVNEIMQILER